MDLFEELMVLCEIQNKQKVGGRGSGQGGCV